MSKIRKILFLAFFLATLVAQTCSTQAWKNQFLDVPASFKTPKFPYAEIQIAWRQLLGQQISPRFPRFAGLYHEFHIKCHNRKAKMYTKISNVGHSLWPFIGIALGSIDQQADELKKGSGKGNPKKPLLITYPFRKVRQFKNFLLNSIADGFRFIGNKNDSWAKQHREKRDHHIAQLARLKKTIEAHEQAAAPKK